MEQMLPRSLFPTTQQVTQQTRILVNILLQVNRSLTPPPRWQKVSSDLLRL